MNGVYVSEPFVVEAGAEVKFTPIELTDVKKGSKDVTSGVLLKNGVPAKRYILKIYRAANDGKKKLLGFTFTDSFGQFTIPLGSLDADYVIKVYSLNEETEDLKIIFD